MQPHNPYEFITNPQKPSRNPLLNPGSKNARIMVFAVGLLILLIIGIVFASFLSSSSNKGKADIVTVVQKQAELVRVSKIALQKSKDINTRGLAMSVNLSMSTQQTKLTSSLKTAGVKINNKVISQGNDPKTDALLTQAEQSNKFDTVFAELIDKELKEYQRAVKTAYDNNQGKKVRQILTEQYEHANILAAPRKKT